MSEKVQCPNCFEPAEKVGNKITCQACDSILTITRTGGAKVVEIGWKEKVDERLGILESQTCYEPEPELELEPEPDDHEEPILPE